VKVSFEGNYNEVRAEASEFFGFTEQTLESTERGSSSDPQQSVEDTGNDTSTTVEKRPEGLPDTADLESGVDITGRLWDSRIDSSSKKKNADGTWKKMRGVDPELYATLTSAVGGNSTATIQDVSAETTPEQVFSQPPAGVPTPPVAPPTGVPTPPVAPPTVYPTVTLADVMAHVAKFREQMLNDPQGGTAVIDAKLNALSVSVGLTRFGELFNPATSPEVVNEWYAKATGK